MSREVAGEMGAKIGLSAEIEPNTLLKTISSVFPFLDFKGKVEGELAGDVAGKAGKSETIEFYPIHTPQRQLVHLTLHYLAQLPPRIEFVDSLAEESWRSNEFIAETPRALVFLDIPPGTKIIPAAAEFENGAVELIYERFEEQLKDDGKDFVQYPKEPNPESLKDYWSQFDGIYSATTAMKAIENASEEHKGGMRWIDYRVMLTDEGDTLHLHICPASNYDTGVFAYNFVKRGYKHGLRLVGTLKSEPDMNVLAVYEK